MFTSHPINDRKLSRKIGDLIASAKNVSPLNIHRNMNWWSWIHRWNTWFEISKTIKSHRTTQNGCSSRSNASNFWRNTAIWHGLPNLISWSIVSHHFKLRCLKPFFNNFFFHIHRHLYFIYKFIYLVLSYVELSLFFSLWKHHIAYINIWDMNNIENLKIFLNCCVLLKRNFQSCYCYRLY